MKHTLDRQNMLLESIRLMQMEFLRSGISYGWCEKTLRDLLALSESKIGFICELIHNKDGTRKIHSHAITNIAWSGKLRHFYEKNRKKGLYFYNFQSLWGACISSGEPVISNDPGNDPRRGGYPEAEGHPVLESFLGLPIKGFSGIVVGIMGVANRAGGYDADMIKFLDPFVSTYGAVIERSRQDRQEKLLREELEGLSSTDDLTGIRNRRAFMKTLGVEWERSKRGCLPISLILIDIDWFKRYNDYYGHIKGDDCLRLVANALASCAKRSGDYFARYGGEEFVLLLPGVPKEEAIDMAGICIRSVSELRIPHDASKMGGIVTLSAGVSSLTPSLREDSSSLIETADMALYRAKKKGRNRVEY